MSAVERRYALIAGALLMALSMVTTPAPDKPDTPVQYVGGITV